MHMHKRDFCHYEPYSKDYEGYDSHDYDSYDYAPYRLLPTTTGLLAP